MSSVVDVCACGESLQKYGNAHGKGVKCKNGYKNFSNNNGAPPKITPCPKARAVSVLTPVSSSIGAASQAERTNVRNQAQYEQREFPRMSRGGGSVTAASLVPQPARTVESLVPSRVEGAYPSSASADAGNITHTAHASRRGTATPGAGPQGAGDQQQNQNPPQTSQVVVGEHGVVRSSERQGAHITVPEVAAEVGQVDGYPNLKLAFYLATHQLPGAQVTDNLDAYVKRHSSVSKVVQRLSSEHTWSGQKREINCYALGERSKIAEAVRKYIPEIYKKLQQSGANAAVVRRIRACLYEDAANMHTAASEYPTNTSQSESDYINISETDVDQLRQRYGGEYGGASSGSATRD